MLLMERLMHVDDLSEAQQSIARWLLAHRDEAERLTCRQVSDAVGTSPTTVVRLSKACGYEGFDELRRELAAESAYLNRNYRGVDVNSPFSPTDSPLRVATKVCSLARETAEDTLALMDGEALERAVGLIDQARGPRGRRQLSCALRTGLPAQDEPRGKARRGGNACGRAALHREPRA